MVKSELIKRLEEIEGDFEVCMEFEGVITGDLNPFKRPADRGIHNALSPETKKKVKLGSTIILL